MDECDNLKQFIIPKRRTSTSDVLLAIDQNSIEYKSDVLEVIQQHFKHKDSLACFAFHNPHIVQNPLLLSEFNEKRKLMKEMCNDKELKCTYAFIHVDSKSEAEKMCREGLHVGNSDMKSLGDPNLGAYVCKYPDILPAWISCRSSIGHLVIFKFIKGKVKTMVENKTGDALEPTPGFDCHVARTSMQSDEFESSQVYVYEYDNNMDVLERPRQLLPFALVAFKFTPKKLDFSKFYKAKVIRKNVNLPPIWPQTFSKGNDTGLTTQQQVNLSEVKIPDPPATMSPNHSLDIHQMRPYTLWSGSVIINNRIICTVNMYSDHFVACPFYLGADIKLNSEFQTDKLFSYFFLDKLDQLNKNELTIWNNICYTYVKLKSTENMTSKLLKIEKYLQDKDSSLLYSVEDSVKLLVVPNCRQAEKLGLDDPDYVHAIFVSNCPNVYATKSGYQKTLKQIIEDVGKTFQPPIVNKSDPRQMKKLLALRGSLNVLDGMTPANVDEAVVPFDCLDGGGPATNDPRFAQPSIAHGIPQCDVIAISPDVNNKVQREEASTVSPNTKNSLEKVVSDSDQISEIEQKLEQDIIKLKLSLKTLSMPFMKHNLEVVDDVPLNEDIDKAKEKDECELRTVIHKEMRGSSPEKHEATGGGNVDDRADGLKALQDYNSFDANAGDHNCMDKEFIKEGKKDDNDAEDEVREKHEDEDDDDDDDMDDDLADQIVLRCLQPSFMSPHVKLDSLGHLQSSDNFQEIDRKTHPNVHYVDFLGLESFHASTDCFVKIKEELNIKSEPVEPLETLPRDNAKLLKRQSEHSLESGEILTPSELSGGGKDDFGDVGNSCTEHQETLVISDNETEGSSVIIVDDLCVIPTRRMVGVTSTSDDDADLPSIIYEYGDDGRLIYRNILVKLLNDSRCTEVKEDELLSNRQDSESALDEDILFEILRKSFKQQYKHNIRCCQRRISISSNSEDEQECNKDDGATSFSNKPGLSPRKVEIGSPLPDLKEQFLKDAYHPSHETGIKRNRSWEDFLLKFLSLSEDHDIEKDHTTVFRKCDARLSDIFQKNSMPRFFRPLYVYKSTLEEIQETFGSLANEIENERNDQEEPVFSSGDIHFFDERKKCVALMDEWVSENNPTSDSSNEAGVCNLRWFQCLNKDYKSKVVLDSVKKTHDDCMASHFFLSSMEDEVSISGIPFLEDVEEKSPSSDEVDERCTYSISREDELMSWPKNLHILDPIPKNCSIQRKVFKGATRILSLRICTAKDPRLARTINSDSVYWSLINRPHSDMEFDIDTDTSFLPELENVIVTIYLNSDSTPSNGYDNSQSKLDEMNVAHYDFKKTLELSMIEKITKVNEQQDLRTLMVNQDYLSDPIYLRPESTSDILENRRIGNSHTENFMAGKYVDNYEVKEYLPDILRNKECKENILEIEGNTTENYSVAFTSSESNGMLNAEAKALVSWSAEMNEYSSSKLFQTRKNKRSFENEFEVCKKLRISKDAETYIEGEKSCKRRNLDHNDRYCSKQSKCNQCLKLTNTNKFKSPINYTHVCKSCKKFFIKKYLKCHRSISQHAAENKDSFLINAFFSLMCFRHLQRKCPNDSKNSSKFLAYFKNVPSEGKILTHRNYIQLEKTVGNVAKHVQKSNRLHHTMFLSALALNYHSQNVRVKSRDTSNQLKQENESINKVVQSCLNDFSSEMDVLLSDLNCISQVPTRQIVCEGKASLFNHFLNLSNYSKDFEPIKPLKRTFCKILSCSTEKIVQTQEKARKPDEIPAANRKCENSWKQIKMNRHGCSSSETKINKSKSIKLTATGGKLIHSRSTSSYLPDFLKIRSRTVSTGSPLCRVSSSDEIVSNPSESSASNSCQDLFICSTSSEVQSEAFERKNNILTTTNNYQNKACVPSDVEVQQMVESQSGISSDKNAISNKNTSNETNYQYSLLNICGPPLQNYQTMFQAQPLRPMLQYPWSNVVLSVHGPPPMLGMTYPIPQALPLCNNFISPIPPPLPMHGFYSIPPPFCFNLPPPIARPCVANVAPPSLDLKIIDKSQHAQRQPTHPQRCEQGSFGTQSKRIYVFNKDRSLSHNIEKFLQFKGALIFDPYNIVMLRNIPNIQCFILVHFQDLDKLDKIPNILQLKKDLRVQFVAYKDVNDVKYQRFQMIFPKGGMLVIEEDTFLALETGIFQSICKSLKRQMSENAKPWRLIFDRAIKGILEDLSSGAREGQHYKGLLDFMKEFEEAGLIHIPADSEKSLKPQKMERYLEICLNLQSSHCSKFRHFLFLTEKVIRSEDSLKFTSRGIDILTISAFAKGFLSMSIKNTKVPSPVKQETGSHAKFIDAVLSSAARPCIISF